MTDHNEINEHPSGYLIMDTCCFLNYIEGKRSDAFEFMCNRGIHKATGTKDVGSLGVLGVEHQWFDW